MATIYVVTSNDYAYDDEIETKIKKAFRLREDAETFKLAMEASSRLPYCYFEIIETELV